MRKIARFAPAIRRFKNSTCGRHLFAYHRESRAIHTVNKNILLLMD